MKKLVLLLALAGMCFLSADAQKKIPVSHITVNEATNRRTEIVLPQVKGFNCYKADLHVHTTYSDGSVNPAGRVAEAWYDGLDIIAITDHLESHGGVKRFFKVTAPYNKNKKPTRYVVPGSTKMPKNGIDPGLKIDFNAIHKEAVASNNRNGYGLLLVKGCEMARNNEKLGHYNALFVDDLNSIYNFELKEAFKNVKKQGGLIIHNHPGNVAKYETEWHADVHKEGLIDGIEVANGLRFYPQMVNRCVDKKYFMLGCTDTHGVTAHRYSTIGCYRTMTIIMAKECTEEAIKEALLKRRTIAYSGGDLIGEEKWLKEFINAAVDCRNLGFVEKKGKTYQQYRFTNLSSITYRLRLGKTIYELQPFSGRVFELRVKDNAATASPTFVVDNMWHIDYKHPTITFKIDK